MRWLSLLGLAAAETGTVLKICLNELKILTLCCRLNFCILRYSHFLNLTT